MVKLMVLAFVGGALSALLARVLGISFLLASIIIIGLLVLCDYLFRMVRMYKYVINVGESYDQACEIAKEYGYELPLGSEEELKAMFGIAYRLPRSIYGLYTHFAIWPDDPTISVKRLIKETNIRLAKNPLYKAMEFMFLGF